MKTHHYEIIRNQAISIILLGGLMSCLPTLKVEGQSGSNVKGFKSSPPPSSLTASELKQIIAKTGSRSGKEFKGKTGGSFQSVNPDRGMFQPQGQYVGDLKFVNPKTNNVEVMQIVVRNVKGQWQVFHLSGDRVLTARNVSAKTEGDRDWGVEFEWGFPGVDSLEITIGPGLITVILDLGPVIITYTTD